MPRRVVRVPGLDHGDLPIPLAVEKDGVLVTGGINGVDPATGERPAGPADQVALVYANIRAILAAAGFDPADVLKVTFFVADRALRAALNPGWVELFPDPDDRPARHTLVQSLGPGVALQAELLAVRR